MKRTAVLIMLCLFLIGFIYTIAAAAEKVAVAPQQVNPKEIKMDLNYDGIVDHTEVYDAEGAVTRVESDVNADGKMDEWVYYENGKPVKAEKDSNKDGVPDTWIKY